MKKIYIQPRMENMPFCTMNALCVSGEVPGGLGGGTNGGHPWDDGRVRRRTPVF